MFTINWFKVMLLITPFLISCGSIVTNTPLLVPIAILPINNPVPQCPIAPIITCTVYNLSSLGNIAMLPDFDNIAYLKIGSITVEQLNAFNTSSTQIFKPFIGTVFTKLTQNFALSCNAKLNIINSGTYNFNTLSDDGIEVSIDGLNVISNEGLHAIINNLGSLHLTNGLHNLNLKYYNNYGYKALVLMIQEPNGVFTLLDQNYLSN